MKIKSLIYAFAYLTVVASCSENDPSAPVIDPDGPVNPEVIEQVLKSATTEWGKSREDLINYMKGYSQVTGTGSDMLVFTTSKSQQVIAYKLYNGQLSATSITIPTASDDLNLSSLLSGYTFLGEQTDGKVYENLSANTLAAIWQKTKDDVDYAAIGFAPIVSDAYEKAPEISVTTGNASAKSLTATVNGSVQGVENSVEVGIIYGYNSNLSEEEGNRVNTTSQGDFTFNLKGLLDDETIYYRAYAVVDDIYYYGDVLSFKTNQLTYTLDGRTFKFIRVEGGPNGDFSIMQTELPRNVDLYIDGDNYGHEDYNHDNKIVQTENRRFLLELYDGLGITFTLPTREEWQYAASGGHLSKGYTYCGSNDIDDVAWYKGNCSVLQPIATKAPNELGLYDMSGNYAEACRQENEKGQELGNGELLFAGVDGPVCGGGYKDAASDCKPTSWIAGSRSGKGHLTLDEEWHTIRMIYYRKK